MNLVSASGAHLDLGAFGSAKPTLFATDFPTGPYREATRLVPRPQSPRLPVTTETLDDEEPLTGDDASATRSQGAFIPRLPADVESLIQRIEENVVVRDTPIKRPQWVQVPKGYLMDLETQPSKFYKERGEVRTEVKKRKREGGLTKSLARGWRDGNGVQGFRPEEVNWNGAVSLEDCPPSNLSNAIHPIFDRSCFDDTPDATYDQLIPGLRLATMFLTQHICMQFWVTLAMGDRSNDSEMSAVNGKLSQRIRSHVELTDERARTVLQHIESVGRSKLVHFRFNRQLTTVEDHGEAYGISLPICDYQGIDTEYHKIDRSHVRSLIRIHSDYYVAAKKLSQLKFQEESQKLRFSFGFAVLIVHELAHSIEGIHFRNRAHQWIDWHTSKWYKEPYWLDWKVSECGRAWEETMFGGHVQPINSKVDGSHGIGIADWPFGGEDDDPRKYRWWTVSMEYIMHLFQMETWQQSFDLKSWRIFNIPRDGATSLFINSFSTMAQSEEERVAKEEAAEVIARAIEEPANKKRIKGLGEAEDRRPGEVDIIKQVEIEEGPKVPSSVSIRQVPKFPDSIMNPCFTPGRSSNARRFSDISFRQILTPHTRKHSLGASVFGSDPRKETNKTTRPRVLSEDSPERDRRHRISQHRAFLREQHQKDNHRRAHDKLTGKLLASLHTKTKQPTSELIKKIKPKPIGISAKHRGRRRAKTTNGLKAVNQKQTSDEQEMSVEHSMVEDPPSQSSEQEDTILDAETSNLRREPDTQTETVQDLPMAIDQGPESRPSTTTRKFKSKRTDDTKSTPRTRTGHIGGNNPK